MLSPDTDLSVCDKTSLFNDCEEFSGGNFILISVGEVISETGARELTINTQIQESSWPQKIIKKPIIDIFSPYFWHTSGSVFQIFLINSTKRFLSSFPSLPERDNSHYHLQIQIFKNLQTNQRRPSLYFLAFKKCVSHSICASDFLKS